MVGDLPFDVDIYSHPNPQQTQDAARRYVANHAHDDADLRLLLEALGLDTTTTEEK